MGPGMFDGLDKLMYVLAALAGFGLVVGAYELARLVLWLVNNVSISVS